MAAQRFAPAAEMAGSRHDRAIFRKTRLIRGAITLSGALVVQRL